MLLESKREKVISHKESPLVVSGDWVGESCEEQAAAPKTIIRIVVHPLSPIVYLTLVPRYISLWIFFVIKKVSGVRGV